MTISAKKVSGRELRRSLKARDALMSEAILPSVGRLAGHAERVNGRLDALEAVRDRGFVGRLRWLLTGR